jgi:hypothetical protein
VSYSEPSGPKQPGKDEFFRLMARYVPLLGLMPGSAAAGYLIGYGLDAVFSTMMLRWVFLVLGVASGIIQTIRLLGRDI